MKGKFQQNLKNIYFEGIGKAKSKFTQSIL